MTEASNRPASAGGRIDEATGVETVGHEWDGIEELNNPLPRWWLIVLYATIVFAIGYVVVYPAIPLANSATPGLWHWSSWGDLAAETRLAEQARASTLAKIAATPLEQIAADEKLQRAAIAGGAAAFKVNCVQCHGAGAQGGVGYPSLKDDEWLWGGDLAAIEQTLLHGIRQPGDAATRTSLMPSFGRDGILTPAQVSDVASHVLALTDTKAAGPSATRGAALYAANCAVCHGPTGRGGRQVGAPDLGNAIWLYGGSRAAVEGSVTNAHAGVMPAWQGRLDPVTIKMLAVYVHSLGGGEQMSAPPPPVQGGADAQP